MNDRKPFDADAYADEIARRFLVDKKQPTESRKQQPDRRDEEIAALKASNRRLDKQVEMLKAQLHERHESSDHADMANEQVVVVSNGPKIYLLARDGVCVYVGKTKQAWPARIGEHTKNWLFDRAYGFPCPSKRLAAVEAHLIEKLSPRYNTSGIKGPRRSVAIAEAIELVKSVISKNRVR